MAVKDIKTMVEKVKLVNIAKALEYTTIEQLIEFITVNKDELNEMLKD